MLTAMTSSPLRSMPTEMDADVVAAIDARLVGVEREHGVAIPWAIESGSRAWGFPSPDSDYDCRFFYVRPAADYLSPWPRRDVIETPLDAVFDVNGWDLIKAVRLATSGNATVSEWLRSPIVYRGDPGFRDELLALVGAVTDRPRLQSHYLHLGRRQRDLALAGGEVRLKRLFYALRPAAALAWLDAHPSGTPPMRLQELLTEADAPAALREAVDALVAQKAVTRELGTGAAPALVADYVATHLDAEPPTLGPPDPHARGAADEAFRALLRFGPEAGCD